MRSIQSTGMLALILLFSGTLLSAQIITPGNGSLFTLSTLQSQYPDDFQLISEEEQLYQLMTNLTLSEGDSFIHLQETAATLLLGPGVFVSWEGYVQIDGGDILTITSADTLNRYQGMDFETAPGSLIRNTHFLYGNGVFVRASDPVFEFCRFAWHGHGYRSGALTLSNSNAQVINCLFEYNSRSGINSAANGNASPLIENSSFVANNTSNGNYPQINLGISNQNTPETPIRIINAYIEGQYPMAGGIAVSNLLGSGFSNAVIENCLVFNNRYGIAQLGGNIHGIITGNLVENNNIDENPMTGGSGLNFNGTATNTAIVSANHITGNLWGVTIQGVAKPNFGMVDDPESPGLNFFDDNGNSGDIFALYNNTPDTIWAQNNIWSATEDTDPETVIFHQNDNSELGPVIFEPVFIETSVFSPYTAGSIQLYPNPATANTEVRFSLSNSNNTGMSFEDNSLWADYPDATWSWYKLDGQLISHGLLIASESMVTPANPGLYLLVIRRGSEIYSAAVKVASR